MSKLYFVYFLILIVQLNTGFVRSKRDYAVSLRRLTVSLQDPKYVTGFKGHVARRNRTSRYTLSLSGIVVQPLYNNVSVLLESYEFKDNQYKQSFIRVTDKLCDVLKNANTWIMVPSFRNAGNLPQKCPVVGFIYAENFEFNMDNLPLFFPISNWRFDFTLKKFSDNEAFLKFEVALSVKAVRPQRNNTKKRN